MGTYYDFALFYKEEGEVKPLSKVQGTFDKELLCGSFLINDITSLDVGEEWERVKDESLKYTAHSFVGYFKKEDLKGLPCTPGFGMYFPSNAKQKVFVKKEDFEKAGLSKHEEGDTAVVTTWETTYKEGWWLDVTSLDKFIENTYRSLKSEILKKERWEKLSQSLEYLKLSEEEKANVRSGTDADYLMDDSDLWDSGYNYHFCLLSSALMLRGVLKNFSNFEREVRMFVFSL